MVREPGGDSDADFDLARRAVDLGWVTREQVEVALLEVELVPDSGLLSHLPLTPDQIHQLKAPAPSLPTELSQAAADPTRRVAQYILAEHHRTGGMGTVVKAWDTRLSRWVALKFIRKVGDDRLRACFEEEARLAAGLSHPNIAAIYEIGEHEGAPFIAMQFIDGRTLEEARRGMKPREAARIMRDAAQAVAFAHERGIIHRDLKPSNVMLDGAGRVYVMDFGLATQTEVTAARRGAGAKRTISGTPEYVSPEQARGEEADERTDVHGLGATLYDLLTGRPPNSGKTIVEILGKLDSSNRIPPRELNRRVEADLETIVLKCLERDRDRRYLTSRELADDLERFLNRDPIVAHRPNVVYRLRMKLAKLKMAVAALITAFLLAGFLGWWFLVGSTEGRHLRLMADGMKLWDEAREVASAGGDPIAIRKRAEKARRVFDRAIQEREAAEALLMRGRCLGLEGRDDESLKSWERAHELEPKHDEARVELAKGLFLKYQSSRGLPSASTAVYGPGDRALLEFKGLPAESKEQSHLRERGQKLLKAGEAAPAQRNLMKGLLSMGMGEFGQAAKELAAYSKEKPWDADAHLLQGLCHYFAREFAASVAALDRSINRVERAGSLVRRGRAKAAQGLHKEALDDYTRAIELEPKFETAFADRAGSKFSMGLHEKAIEDYTKAIDLNPRYATLWNSRGTVHWWKELNDEAIADFDRAIELDPDYVEAYVNRGAAKRAKGLNDAAIADYDRAILLDPHYVLAYYNRGIAKGAKGLKDEAIRDYTKAMELYPEYGEAYVNRGNARRDKGLVDDALADFNEAIRLNPKNAIAWNARGSLRTDCKGLHDEAIEDSTKALELDPKFSGAYTCRGKAKIRKGLPKEAILDFTRAIDLDPKNGSAYYHRGNMKLDLRLENEAIADFTSAIELGFSVSWAYNNRGLARERKGLHDAAIEDYNQAIAADPSDASAYHNRGAIKTDKKGLHEEAVVDFTKALELAPDNPIILRSRGLARVRLGRVDEAIADWEKVLIVAPAGWPHRADVQGRLKEAKSGRGFHVAIKLLQEKRYREAIEKFTELLDATPNSRLAIDCAYNIACAYSLLGEKKDALDWLEKAVELGWKDVAHLEKDPDLESLRSEERYRKVVARLRAE